MNVPTKCQSVSNVLAIRQQPYGRIYRARVYENTHKMGEENACVVMWKCVFNNVEMHIWLWEYAFLVMLGYGHDESAPTPGGVFCGVSWVGVTLFVNRSQCYRQSVRSCRGPIYRARVHEIPQNGVAYLHCWRCNSYHFDTSKPFGSD